MRKLIYNIKNKFKFIYDDCLKKLIHKINLRIKDFK